MEPAYTKMNLECAQKIPVDFEDTSLYKFAQTCDFGTETDAMIFYRRILEKTQVGAIEHNKTNHKIDGEGYDLSSAGVNLLVSNYAEQAHEKLNSMADARQLQALGCSAMIAALQRHVGLSDAANQTLESALGLGADSILPPTTKQPYDTTTFSR